MPLKKGSSKAIVKQNIREFHTGKTYAHTAAKFGKEKANKQAIAVALSTARKYAKKADGGADLGADDWKAKEAEANFAALTPAEQKSIQTAEAPPPQRDWGKGFRDWWYGGQPTSGEVDPFQDPISRMGKGALEWAMGPGKALNEGMTDQEMADWGAEGALNMIGTGLVKPVRGGLGTAGGFTTKGAEKASDIHQAVMEAAMYGDKHYNPEALEKELKSFYPKDIANSAFYLGISPEDLTNLKGYMSKGAQDAFDKHYNKMAKNPAAKKAAVELNPEEFEQQPWEEEPEAKKPETLSDLLAKALSKFKDDKGPAPSPEEQYPITAELQKKAKELGIEPKQPEEKFFGEEPPPAGPEGWNAHEHYDEGEPVPHNPDRMPFHEAFKEAAYDHYLDFKGGPWKNVKTFAQPQDVLLKKMTPDAAPNNFDGPYSYADVVSILSKKPFAESGVSEHGIYGGHIKQYLSQFDAKQFLSSMTDHHLTDTQVKNILSYLPPNMVEQMKGILGKELTELGHAPPIEKLSPEAQKALATNKIIDESLKPIDWKSYKPPRVKKPEEMRLSKTPEELRALGFNPDFPLYKGGHLQPEQIANKTDFEAYPSELIDPQTGKFSEKALFLADEPHVASQYGKLSKYIARPSKAVEVDWAKLAKQIDIGSESYNSGEVHYNGYLMNKIIASARKQGADVVIMHNMWDLGGPQTQYAFLNTHPLRAPHAEFEPSKLHLRYPLAGLVGGGILGYGALNSGESEAGHMKRGGKVKHEQIDENPQEHEFINFARGGLIDSHIPGRTDKIPMKVATGAYVLPADIPSALGQGNSKAGAEILKKMFTHSAYGLPPPHVHSTAHPPHLHFHAPKHARGGKVAAEKVLPSDHQLGMKVPKGGSMCANCRFLDGKNLCGNKGFQRWNGSDMLPHPANEYCCDLYEHAKPDKRAEGGGVDRVPIIAAGGEYVIHPDVVKHIGGGDMKTGHKILDNFVISTRKEHINTLKKLKPPK